MRGKGWGKGRVVGVRNGMKLRGRGRGIGGWWRNMVIGEERCLRVVRRNREVVRR
jgi:hypothetical protein